MSPTGHHTIDVHMRARTLGGRSGNGSTCREGSGRVGAWRCLQPAAAPDYRFPAGSSACTRPGSGRSGRGPAVGRVQSAQFTCEHEGRVVVDGNACSRLDRQVVVHHASAIWQVAASYVDPLGGTVIGVEPYPEAHNFTAFCGSTTSSRCLERRDGGPGREPRLLRQGEVSRGRDPMPLSLS